MHIPKMSKGYPGELTAEKQWGFGGGSLQDKLANFALHRLAGWPLQYPSSCMLPALFVGS